jgi:hypothetical protein
LLARHLWQATLFGGVITLSNVTGQRIVALKLRFKADDESQAVTAFRVTIEPHGTYTSSRNSVMSGNAERMRVQVLGVQFEDGSIWGAMNSNINARDAVVPIPDSISRDSHEETETCLVHGKEMCLSSADVASKED